MEGVFAVLITILVLSIPIAALWKRGRERRSAPYPDATKQSSTIEERTRLLEDRVASLTEQLQELEAKNQFLSKLLEERSEGGTNR